MKDVEGNHILYHCLHATKRHQLCLEIALRYGADVHLVVSYIAKRTAQNSKTVVFYRRPVTIIKKQVNAPANLDMPYERTFPNC